MSVQPEVSTSVSPIRVHVPDDEVVRELVAFCNARIARGSRDAWIAVADRLVERLWDGDLDAALAPAAESHVTWRALLRHPDLQLSRNMLYRCRGLLRLRRELPGGVFRGLRVGHLYALLPLPDSATRRALAQQALAERWTCAVLRRAVAGLLGKEQPPAGRTAARRARRAVEGIDLDAIRSLPPREAGCELAALSAAVQDLWRRLHEATGALSERLTM